MLVFPAIDLMNGEVVRLRQGKAEEKTVYSTDAIKIALEWQSQGAQCLHLVDLDGAFTGNPKNLGIVADVVRNVDIFCQLGGGLRDLGMIELALQTGVGRVVLGSKACDSLDFVKEAVEKFGGHRIAIGIDAKNGKVAVKGWTEESSWWAIDLAKAVVEAGVSTIIYTDITSDGTLQGPNLLAIQEMAKQVKVKLISSGGISSTEDIQNLAGIPGVHGVIIGKALYDKKFTLSQCLSIAREG
ncbi:MAG: 1-(5-phosphoribosyl)-5-[(5-phosphoribosylamino)methylideneamino]imidazole-4-carboxamide isomerase [Verrucomicrobiota bacterium]